MAEQWEIAKVHYAISLGELQPCTLLSNHLLWKKKRKWQINPSRTNVYVSYCSFLFKAWDSHPLQTRVLELVKEYKVRECWSGHRQLALCALIIHQILVQVHPFFTSPLLVHHLIIVCSL